MILKLVFKNAFRHKLRAALTVLGMCIVILAFGMLRTVISAWYSGVAASSANRLVTRNSVSIIFSLPISYKEKIRAVSGVTIVSYGNWFGGIYIDEKNFFANFAIDPVSYLNLYPEFTLPEEQKTAFLKDRKACVVGQKLAKRFGWKIGDNVTLKGTIFPGNWEFVLRGIYVGRDEIIDETQFFFHWDYLNESLKKTVARRADMAGFYIVGVANADLAAGIAETIDGLFRNSFAETLTETEKAFQMTFISYTEAILTAIRVISFMVIVIIMAVVANTMAMSVRERMREYAVFKTLGFGAFHILGLILGESLVITSVGGAIGIVLTFPVVKAFGKAVSNWIPVFIVESETIYMDIAAILTVGVVAAIIPSWRAITMRIADGLRGI